MRKSALTKLNSVRGANRLIVVLVCIAAVLLALALVPAVRAWLWHGERDGCDIALRRTRDMLATEYLGSYHLDTETACDLILEKGSLCPTGGDFYVVEDPESKIGMDVVCALHDSDKALCTRLNSSSARDQLSEELAAVEKRGEPIPEAVTVTLNSQLYEAVLVDEEPDIYRGTGSTSGYEGTVLFYRMDEEGDLSYFCYADKAHCAVWRRYGGWTGDCFS